MSSGLSRLQCTKQILIMSDKHQSEEWGERNGSITAGGCQGVYRTSLTHSGWKQHRLVLHFKYTQEYKLIMLVGSLSFKDGSQQTLCLGAWSGLLSASTMVASQPAWVSCGPFLILVRTPLVLPVVAAREAQWGPSEDLWDPVVLLSHEKGITNKLLRAST